MVSHVLLCTQSPIPASTNAIPIQVSLLMTFFSAHHSPSTVNKNASELVMGTVRLNSAFPIKIKNHTLPVMFKSKGTAYAGLDKTPMTAYHIPSTFFFSHELFGSVRDGR